MRISRRTAGLLAGPLSLLLLPGLAAVADTTLQVTRGGPTTVGTSTIAYQRVDRTTAPGTGAGDPAPPTATGRLGLHVTAQELAVWQVRATAGPFRTGGDAWTNSPGDWTRIRANADALAADPARYLWAGPADNNPGGCVTGTGTTTRYDPPATARTHVRDAAFAALVTGDATLRRKAAGALLQQARASDLRFGNRSRWCIGAIGDLNPGFEIAGMMSALVFAYDYLTVADPAVFTTSERRELLDWFAHAAEWMTADVDSALGKNFTDRLQRAAPPYTLTSARSADPGITDVPYAGAGERIGTIARFYNNRRANLMRYVGLVGVLLQDEGYAGPSNASAYTAGIYRERAQRFVKDWLVYSVYADGFVGEFERWKSSLPDLGWAYGTQVLGPVLTIADTFARAGDDSLYRWTTTAGVHGTQGAPAGASGKSLAWVTRAMTGYLDGTTLRYMPGHAGDTAYAIDGRHTASGWHSLHDLAFVPAARYFADARLDRVLERRNLGGYPSRPAGVGAHSPFGGDWGIYPAVLLMFGGTGDLASPYG